MLSFVCGTGRLHVCMPHEIYAGLSPHAQRLCEYIAAAKGEPVVGAGVHGAGDGQASEEWQRVKHTLPWNQGGEGPLANL